MNSNTYTYTLLFCSAIVLVFITLPITGFCTLIFLDAVKDLGVDINYDNSLRIGLTYYVIALALRISNNFVSNSITLTRNRRT